MEVTKTRVQNVDNYLTLITGSDFRISSPELTQELLNKLDLNISNFSNGFSILPKRLGSVSKFNADGKYIPLKNLAKESRCIGERIWNWKDYGGNEHSKTIDIIRIFSLGTDFNLFLLVRLTERFSSLYIR